MSVVSVADKTHFSSEVRLTLEFDGQSLSVCAVGPHRFVLRHAQLLEVIEAELVVTINGQPRRSPIRIEAQSEAVREYQYTRK